MIIYFKLLSVKQDLKVPFGFKDLKENNMVPNISKTNKLFFSNIKSVFVNKKPG